MAPAAAVHFNREFKNTNVILNINVEFTNLSALLSGLINTALPVKLINTVTTVIGSYRCAFIIIWDLSVDKFQ